MVQRRWGAIAVAGGTFALLLLPGATLAQAAPAPLLRATKPDRIAGHYIVVLKDSAGTRSASRVARTARRGRGRIAHEYRRALSGFAAKLSDAALADVRADPAVAFVEPDARVWAQTTQAGATWGLDRVDQPALPLNATYEYSRTGAGVTAYIIDSGVRTSHSEFGGRASSGKDIIDGGAADDCNGHGTHVAGTVGGSKYGVAKQVKLVAVRVLGCDAVGTESGVAAGIDWVTANHVGGQPAVATMSLGAETTYPAMELAIKKSIADGVTYTIAAGNYGINACAVSPARVPAALTVGATDATDARSYSNFGSCVDVFAPGTDIKSAWNTANNATATMIGTSMATPHVAGVAALYLQEAPSSSPATVASAVVTGAVGGKVADAGSGSPNRLVQSQLVRKTTTLTTIVDDLLNIVLGLGTLSDTVTVNGRANPQPGATIDFRLYGPNDLSCSRAPVFESLDVPYPVAGGPVTSAPFRPTLIGVYRWAAAYSGDANNAPTVTGCKANGDVTVQEATPAPTPTPVAPGLDLPSDTSLDFRLAGNRKQRPLRNSRGLALKLSCPEESCTVEVSGTMTVPARTKGRKARKFALKGTKVTLVDTKPMKLRLKLSSALRRHVARALGAKRTRNGVKVQLKATASDVASNHKTRKLTVRVRR